MDNLAERNARISSRNIWVLAAVLLIVGAALSLLIVLANPVQKRASRREVELGLQSLADQTRPLLVDSERTYLFDCVLEEIQFRDEDEEIRVDPYAITVTGDCAYFDTTNRRQVIRIALVVENSIERTTFIASRITQYIIRPEALEEVFFAWFNEDRKIVPGAIVGVSFGLPVGETPQDFPAVRHHAPLIQRYHSAADLENFATSKDPDELPYEMLVPLDIAKDT